MIQYDTILLDIDGTLLDFEKAEQEALERGEVLKKNCRMAVVTKYTNLRVQSDVSRAC